MWYTLFQECLYHAEQCFHGETYAPGANVSRKDILSSKQRSSLRETLAPGAYVSLGYVCLTGIVRTHKNVRGRRGSAVPEPMGRSVILGQTKEKGPFWGLKKGRLFEGVFNIKFPSP